jgi:hypothetical protein
MTKATLARVRGDETMNAKWYWPPVEGYAELSSASPAAIEIYCQLTFYPEKKTRGRSVRAIQWILTDDAARHRGNEEAPEHIWTTARQQRVWKGCGIPDPGAREGKGDGQRRKGRELARELALVALGSEFEFVGG